MVNLSKCDKCGNRNIMCFMCNDNKHYREWKHSHDRMIRNIAIDEFAEKMNWSYQTLIDNGDCSTNCKGCLEEILKSINEIAEQLKGGSDER